MSIPLYQAIIEFLRTSLNQLNGLLTQRGFIIDLRLYALFLRFRRSSVSFIITLKVSKLRVVVVLHPVFLVLQGVNFSFDGIIKSLFGFLDTFDLNRDHLIIGFFFCLDAVYRCLLFFLIRLLFILQSGDLILDILVMLKFFEFFFPFS